MRGAQAPAGDGVDRCADNNKCSAGRAYVGSGHRSQTQDGCDDDDDDTLELSCETMPTRPCSPLPSPLLALLAVCSMTRKGQGIVRMRHAWHGSGVC